MKQIYNTQEFPTEGQHYAALHFTSVYIPDQGVWAPGHGYPANNHPVVEYHYIGDEAQLQKWANSKTPEQLRDWQVIRAEAIPLIISVQVQIPKKQLIQS